MWRRWHRDEFAQDAFEYVLAIGVVVVLVAASLLALDAVVEGALGAICPSVDTAQQATPTPASPAGCVH